MDMENKLKFRGPYFEPLLLSIPTSSGNLFYSNQKDEGVDRGNILKMWSFSSPAHSEMKCLYTCPITSPFVYSSNVSYVFLYLLLSLSLSLSQSVFKGLKSVQTIWCVFLLECNVYFSRLSSAGNARKLIRFGICLASSHFVCSESFNFMASARQQPEGRIRKPSVWNDIACTVYVYLLTHLSTIPPTHTHTFMILLFEEDSG